MASKVRAVPEGYQEIYTPERKAEFLLSNAVDAKDYRDAQAAVRRMGIDPAKVRHKKPSKR